MLTHPKLRACSDVHEKITKYLKHGLYFEKENKINILDFYVPLIEYNFYDIQYFNNLETLYIKGEECRYIQEVDHLKNINEIEKKRYIKQRNCSCDIDGNINKTNLNMIYDWSPIYNLKNLKHLILHYNFLDDKIMKEIIDNSVWKYTIETIDISGNSNITDLGIFTELPNLISLSYMKTGVFDDTFLNGYPKIKLNDSKYNFL